MASPEAQIPVGFRFHPTEEELVDHYLKRKLAGDESVNDTIAEVDVCKVEPWDLPALSKVKSDDSEWFFFSPRGLKYTNSNRSNRKTMGGYWKPTGKDRKIKIRGTNNVIGIKKNLTFYKGRVSRAVKTNWIIHEYHADTSHDFQKTFVLCRLIEKIGKKVEGKDALINDQEKPGYPMASDYENQALLDGVLNVYSSSDVDMNLTLQEVEYDSTLIQQKSSFQYASVTNVYHGSPNSNNEFPFETTEEEPGYSMTSDYENQALSNGVPNTYSLLYVDMDSIPQEVEYDSTSIQQEKLGYPMASDYENQALLDGVSNVYSSSDVDMNSTLQEVEYDFTSIQQKSSFQYASATNVYHGRPDSSNKFPFETIEEESCYPIAFDYENQALSNGVPNMYSLLYVDMDSIPQEVEYESTSIQQRPSFQYASVPNVYHGNKDSNNKFPFETIEDEDNIEEFLNSVFVNEDSFFSEERSKHVPLILPHQSYQEEQTLNSSLHE